MATAVSIEAKSGRGKSIEDQVPYALNHRIRIALLIVLNQGVYCASELADLIGEPLNKVSNHLDVLWAGGSIEVVEQIRRRNFSQSFYRAVEIPEHSKEDLVRMTLMERQMIAGLNAQALMAEVMGSLHADKISEDPNHCFVWDRLNLDELARREVTAEQERHIERLAKIEEESLLRCAASGEPSTPYVVAALGFERGREVPYVRTSGSAD